MQLLTIPKSALNGPRYKQIEAALQEAVRGGVYKPGDRIPSIRELAKIFDVSKPTVETAMRFLVANGYLIAKDRSGFCVAALPEQAQQRGRREKRAERTVRFDYRESSSDPELFPIESWRRSIFRASRDRSLLAQYGDPQGEKRLRAALSRYLRESRGVRADPDSIVIGAGLLSFTRLFHRIFAPETKRMALEGAGFPLLEGALHDFGWETERFLMSGLQTQNSPVLYLGSDIEGGKRRLTAAERLAVLHYIDSRGAWLLEDDYTGEFRSRDDASSSLQSMNPDARILYFGSFSRIFSPSLRVSFLVVPPCAQTGLADYMSTTTQTASALEQLALADFIERGELRRHVRQVRQQADRKIAMLEAQLKARLSERFRISVSASHLSLLIESAEELPPGLQEAAKEEGVLLKVLSEREILASPSSVPFTRLGEAAEVLAAFLNQSVR
jgi:GntR family transcriptional regulator/MocR family aminotransferase